MRKEGVGHIAAADSLTDMVADASARLLLQVRLSNLSVSRFYAGRDSLLAAAKETVPDDIVVLMSEAMRASEDNDLGAAETLYEHILEINPNFASAYNFLGYLYLARGQYDEAETAMRRYSFVAPDLANPHDSLGDVLSVVGRYEEAEAEYKTALAKQPDFFYSQKNIAWVYMDRGEVDRCVGLMEQVLTGIDGTPYAEGLLAEFIDRLFAHRLTPELDTYAARFLEKYPEGSAAPSVRVRRLFAHGETAPALALIDSTYAVYQQEPWYGVNQGTTARVDARTAMFRALAAEQENRHEDAVRLLRQALDALQDQPAHYKIYGHIQLAYNLIPIGALDEARLQVRQVLQINPRQPEAVLVAASIEAAAGQAAEARRLLDTLDRVLERADQDFPALVDGQKLRQRLPDPEQI
jgi:tetratricopeptide (TPR) repeat protein